RLWPSLAESTHSLAQVLSSRPKGRALCGPQRRDRGTIAPILSTLSFRVERPDLFFRADLWRVGSRSRGIPLPSSSVLLGFPSGVTQTYELEGAPSPASGGKGGFLRSNATNSLLLSLPFHYSALPLAFLCALCVPPSVISVLTSFFFLLFPSSTFIPGANDPMTLFPAFLKLENRQVIIIGGGSLAESKLPALLEAGARVRLISPRLNPSLTAQVRARNLDWWPKLYEQGDLAGAFLVIAATSIPEVNAAVFREAEARNILCNAVDDIANCHFYFGSIVQRGDLQIAISTNGKSPALAQRLRKELAQQFGPEYAAWLDWLGAARQILRAQDSEPELTKQWLHLLASRPMFEKFLHDAAAQNSQRGAP